jgi:hypothetical protein
MITNDQFKAVSFAAAQLDLEPIKTKLMHIQSGEGWSLDKADAVEKEYRRFLCLMKLYPDEDTAPLVDVDTFWHYHILDTMKYAADCQAVFGYFLHHYPYVGMRGEDDEQFRLDSGERMRELYESTFGEAYPGANSDAMGDDDSPAMDAVASAYCAGPRIKALAAAGEGAVAATAYCAGPREKMTAYCAGPRDNTTAYCAGPRISALAHAAEGAVAATAYCAGPRIKVSNSVANSVSISASTAAAVSYCAGPRDRMISAN